MTASPPPPPAPRVLIVSSRLSPGRHQALAALAGTGPPARLVALDGCLPDPGGYDAVVMDGPLGDPDQGWGDLLRPWVEGGGTLVAIGSAPAAPGGWWASLLGVVSEPGASGEWFVEVGPGRSDLTTRLPREIPILDHFQPLRAEPGAKVVLEVSVAYQHLPALVVRERGAGSVMVVGLANTDGSLGHPDLRLVLRRGLAGALRPAPREAPLGLAVAGYGAFGGMGQVHGLAVQATEGMELIATCDPDPDRRKAAEADFPGMRAYGRVEELAADVDVDVVVVATPPASHTPVALSLLRAGKHVALEKPMCFTVAQADQLMAAASSHGRVLTVNQSRRWDADFRAIRQVVDGAQLGQLFNMETFVGGFEHPCRAWHSEESLSGGAVYDWGSHHLDWVLLLMGGPPATVVAHGHKRVWRDVTNFDQLRVHLDWADGREAEFVQSDVAAVRRPKFYLQGTAGTLVGHYRPVTFERMEVGRGYVAEPAHHAEAPADLVLVRYESGWGLTETRIPPARHQAHPFHRNLADHLHRAEPLAVTPESVRPVIAVLESAHRSSRDGGRVVPLAAAAGESES